MKTSLRTIGNSKGAVIPAALLKELNINAGDPLDVVAENGRLIITPSRKPTYTLDELLAQCDPSTIVPSDMADWESMPPVGNEI